MDRKPQPPVRAASGPARSSSGLRRPAGGQRSDVASDPAPVVRDVVVQCLQVTKTFHDFWHRHQVRAVDALDLEVRRGEVLGLLGPNGSGKSTTIKMILGLLYPSSGQIAVFGQRPEHVGTKRLIGYLPEGSYFYRFLNARETLEYTGSLFGLGRGARRVRIDMLLDMVGLDKVKHRPVGEFSTGMQRRIGLAQALINDPQLLILDEPTAGLDPIGTRQIKDLILELSHRGKTILLCSHLLADVEDVCDRVAIMFGGRVRASGAVDDLLVRHDVTTIFSEALDEHTIEQVERVLQRSGKHITKVEQPRQRLETLFLNVVHQAQAEGADTSGARSGGQIAEFLRTQQSEPRERGSASGRPKRKTQPPVDQDDSEFVEADLDLSEQTRDVQTNQQAPGNKQPSGGPKRKSRRTSDDASVVDALTEAPTKKRGAHRPPSAAGPELPVAENVQEPQPQQPQSLAERVLGNLVPPDANMDNAKLPSSRDDVPPKGDGSSDKDGGDQEKSQEPGAARQNYMTIIEALSYRPPPDEEKKNRTGPEAPQRTGPETPQKEEPSDRIKPDENPNV